MHATLSASPAYELTIDLNATPYGHDLQLRSFVPMARVPERQVRFRTVLDRRGLEALRDVVEAALGAAACGGPNAADSAQAQR